MHRIICVEKPFAERGIGSSFAIVKPEEQGWNTKQAEMEETDPSIKKNLHSDHDSTSQIITCDQFLFVVTE